MSSTQELDDISLYDQYQLWYDENERWFGQKVQYYKGTIDSIRQKIPHFTRKPFSLGRGENVYFDVIFKEPLNNEKTEDLIPVGTVSKQYKLIQHHGILDILEQALQNVDHSMKEHPCELKISEYGERILFSTTLLGFGFDPGDGYPIVLKVNCVNSVDTTTAMEINLIWYRLVCGDGLMFGKGRSKFRKYHLKSLKAQDIAEYLKKQLNQIHNEKQLYKRWLNTEIDMYDIDGWADEKIAKTLGVYIAARVCHIAKTGWDDEVINPHKKKVKPHERIVTNGTKVPGLFPPVKDAYHVSQILSWISRSGRMS